jgi:hypothetical protein
VSRSISKKRRFELFKRDGFACQYCGAKPPGAILEIDHIVAVAEGGADDDSNLITSCFPCNRGKSARRLSDAPQALAERAREASERESQLAAYEAVLRVQRERLEADAEEAFSKVCDCFGAKGLPTRDFTSIKNFVRLMGVDEVFDAIDISSLQGPPRYDRWFRYFCGVCWTKIRDRQERQAS